MTVVTFLITSEIDENAESYLTDTFLPILRAVPGATDVLEMRVLASTTEALRLRWQFQLRFDDEDAMNTAFASTEGRNLSRELMARQGKGVEMLTAEIGCCA